MNILVCISCVPSSTSKINFTEDQRHIYKTDIQWIINPLDEYVLSKAILLQQQIEAKISVITIGTNETEELLRKTLAMGADSAIRINCNPQDSLNTAKQIAAFIQDNHFDLILTGKESADYQNGITPALIAQLLNIPFINSCYHLEINGKEVISKREIHTHKETIKASLPIVIAGQKGIVKEKELIIPNIRGMINAKNKPLTIIEPIAYLPETDVYFEQMPKREDIKYISPDNLDELIRILHEEEKVI